MNVDAAARSLERTLKAQGTPARAEQERRYLKSSLTFFGATVPVIRRTAKSFVREQPSLEREELLALANRLWQTEVHELRSVAIGILELRADLLRASDARWLMKLVRGAGTWAHVDWLAAKVLGPLALKHVVVARGLDKWVENPSFWVRRAALLAFHDPLLAGGGDFEHFARLAVPLLKEREFFIRKAIGWVLRSTSIRTPARTYDFVQRHAREMSGLTFREATRRLSVAQQRRLRALLEGAEAPRSSGQRERSVDARRGDQ